MLSPPPPSDWILRWQHLLAAHCTVLDLACGAGRHLRHFAQRGHRVTGVDRNAEALAPLVHLGEMLPADLENGPWPLAQRQFAAVIVTNSSGGPAGPNCVTAWPQEGCCCTKPLPTATPPMDTPGGQNFYCSRASCSACVLAGTSWRTSMAC